MTVFTQSVFELFNRSFSWHFRNAIIYVFLDLVTMWTRFKAKHFAYGALESDSDVLHQSAVRITSNINMCSFRILIFFVWTRWTAAQIHKSVLMSKSVLFICISIQIFQRMKWLHVCWRLCCELIQTKLFAGFFSHFNDGTVQNSNGTLLIALSASKFCHMIVVWIGKKIRISRHTWFMVRR